MIDEETIARYLLGELPDEEQARIEARYFSDDEFHDRVRAVESDLVEAYVRGELDSPGRERFEATLAVSPRLRKRAAFMAALLQGLPAAPAARAPVAARRGFAAVRRAFLDALGSWPAPLRVALVAATVAVVIGGLWIAYLAVRAPEVVPERAGSGPIAPPRIEQPVPFHESPSPEPPTVAPDANRPTAPSSTNRAEPPRPAIAALVLTPGLSRGENDVPRLTLPSGTTQVRLTLPLTGDAGGRYRATIRPVDGVDAVWQQEGLRASRVRSGVAVVVRVPTHLLAAKTYVVTLDHATADGERETDEVYPFEVALERNPRPR